jgi:ubiquitin carboxyl-terminal hydrolase 4/11/15
VNIDENGLGDLNLDDMDTSPSGAMVNGNSKVTDIDNFDENGTVDNSSSPDEKCNPVSIITSQPQLSPNPAQQRPKHYFALSAVYQTGSTDIQKLDRKKQEPFLLAPQACVAVDWKPEVKKLVYRKDAEETERHSSMEVKPDVKKSVDLQDCIELFLQKERLGPSDPWYCPRCKDFKQATKKFDLWSLPHILVIHLKRFSYNRYFRDKLDNLIKFPKDALEFNQFVINPKVGHQVYDLIGVVNHYGGLGGGHYTAYCKNAIEKQWYDFDDTRVSKTSAEATETTAAYVLFYQRRERTPLNIIPPKLIATNGESSEDPTDKMDTN